MRKLLLLAATIGATVMVRRKAAEQGVTPGAFVSNSLQQALARLMGEPAPARKA